MVVRGNRITAIGAHPAIPNGVVEIDGNGKFRMPGLWHMHAYFVSEPITRELADLILLDRNPLERIANTRRMAGVFHDGHCLSESARIKLLLDVEVAAAAH